MNDQDLSDLLGNARAASRRADFSAQEYGFETRLAARLTALPAAGMSAVHIIWRMAAGCAAMVGVMGVWFIVVQSPTETEDDLTAFWDGGQISLDADFLN